MVDIGHARNLRHAGRPPRRARGHPPPRRRVGGRRRVHSARAERPIVDVDAAKDIAGQRLLKFLCVCGGKRRAIGGLAAIKSLAELCILRGTARSPTAISRRLSSRSRQNTSKSCCPRRLAGARTVLPETGPDAGLLSGPAGPTEVRDEAQSAQTVPRRCPPPRNRCKRWPRAPATRWCHRSRESCGCRNRAET